MPDFSATQETLLRGTIAEALRPDPQMRVSEWADTYRILDTAESPSPGKWHSSRFPFAVEVMDRLSSYDPCREVWVMKAAQLGFTEVLNNWIGYVISHSPGPMMVVYPTINTARRTSRHRLNPMIANCPELQGKLGKELAKKSENDQTYLKTFPGGILAIAGANSAAELSSMPVRRLGMDEIDRFPQDLPGEGDPIDLAKARTSKFSNAKVYGVATPTVKGISRIEEAYEQGDQRKYFVPCPHCDAMQDLVFDNLKYRGEGGRVVYQCAYCGTNIDEEHKNAMLAKGEWRPTAESKVAGVLSYHINQLYAPYGLGKSGWADILEAWQKARKDLTKTRVFYNLVLGLPFDESEAESLNASSLVARCEAKDWRQELPEQAALITAAVDVQGNRLECEIVAWGAGEESWSLDYHVIDGDPMLDECWQKLDEILATRYKSPGVDEPLRISACCIDTGYLSKRVYAYCNARGAQVNPAIWPVKGREGWHMPAWPNRKKRVRKDVQVLYTVGVDSIKDWIAKALRIDTPGSCYMHFPQERDEIYFLQLTAERLVVTRDARGRKIRRWVKQRQQANEALDLRVYNYAALQGLAKKGATIDRAVDTLDRARQRGGAGAGVTVPVKRPRPEGLPRGMDRSGHRSAGKRYQNRRAAGALPRSRSRV